MIDGDLHEIIEPRRSALLSILNNPDSDAELAGPARAYLWGADVTPLGAGALAAALLTGQNRGDAELARRVADALVREHGVAFAAAATAYCAGITTYYGLAGQYRLWRGWDWGSHASIAQETLAHRMRAHLAAASDDEHAQAVQALADVRGGLPIERIVAAYLVPDQVAWVDELCREVTSPSRSENTPTPSSLVLCALSTAQQLYQVAGLFRSSVGDMGILTTLVEGVGPAAAPYLMYWFDCASMAEDRQRLLRIVAQLPTDQAMQALIDRLDQKYVAPALDEMVKRYPRRALRLLAEASAGTSALARTAADLLRRHVLARPDLVETVAPTLSAAARARVESVTAPTARVTEADPATLPAVLVTPPWTVKRAAPKPVVVAGLTPTIERGMAWAPGERQSWARGHPRPGTWNPEWAQELEHPVMFRREKYRALAVAMGPENVARPLLDTWKPEESFFIEPWIRCIVARFGTDAARLAVCAARLHPAGLGSALLPFAHGEIAPLVADWLVRLKSARSTALAWLTRHPRVAALALIPAALGQPGAKRREAETALRAIAAGGHAEVIRTAAATYGEPAARGVDALLAVDPLDLVPTRVPSLPDWAAPELHPQVLLRERASALPATAVTHLATMLAFSRLGEVYAGIEVVKEIVDRDSLAEWGWSLFLAWQEAGLPAKHGWVLDAQGMIGNDETVRRLAPIIRAWPDEGGHARAVRALDVLAAIGTNVALMHLHGLAQKAGSRGLRNRAGEKIAEVAAGLGLTSEQLADRLVPDLGLEPDGRTVLDYGRRRFVVGFDEQLRPYVCDEDGTRRKDLPKPGATDDPTLAPAAYQRFAALKKDVRTIAKDEIRRLEQAMVMQRRWTAAEFRELFLGHPLLWHLVRRLVWGVYDTDGGLSQGLRVAEDRTFADVNDETIELDAQASVGVVHPLHLGDTLTAWANLFADYEIVQPFPQLDRPTYRLAPEEHDATRLTRFEGLTVPTTRVLGLTNRGWQRGEPQDAGAQVWMTRELPGDRALVVNLDPGLLAGAPTMYPAQKLEAIWINNRPEGNWWSEQHGMVRFGDLDPVTASEILRDLTDLAS